MEKALHIECAKEEIAPLVLMPGDPLRAKYIAKNFLEKPVLINKLRNMYGYTGYYKGIKISVMSSGMGMPSMSIYALELFKYYGVQRIIRIGTCGALNPEEKLLDIILGSEFYTFSNFAKSLYNEDVHIVEASKSLNNCILNAANNLNKKMFVGTIITMDVFGPYASIEAKTNHKPEGVNAVGEEMEGFALAYIAKKLNREATCMATIVDSPYEKTVISPENREKSLNDMITIALEAIIN